jgi:hypothetical protein
MRRARTRGARGRGGSVGSASPSSRAATPGRGGSRSAGPAAPPAVAARAAALDQVDRPLVAVLLAQELRRPRRLDLRPLLEQPPQDPLEGVELGIRRRPPVAGRLHAPRQPRHRPPIHLKPPRDLPLRDPVRRQRPHLRPLHRAQHLLPSSLDALIERPSFGAAADAISGAASGALFAYRSRRSIRRPASAESLIAD